MLESLDRKILQLINQQWYQAWLTEPMEWLREATTWIPLYMFMLYWFIRNCKQNWLLLFLLSLVCFALTDYGSAGILKPLLGRVRPCYEESLGFAINNPVGCGGRFSMPSSHASNHFGLATFWFFCIKYLSGKSWYWLWVWAAAIGYAQVFVGVHYPFDIVVGASLGILCGNGCMFIFIKLNDYLLKKDRLSSMKNAI